VAASRKWTNDVFFEVKGERADVQRHCSSKRDERREQMRLNTNALRWGLRAQRAAFTRSQTDGEDMTRARFVVSANTAAVDFCWSLFGFQTHHQTFEILKSYKRTISPIFHSSSPENLSENMMEVQLRRWSDSLEPLVCLHVNPAYWFLHLCYNQLISEENRGGLRGRGRGRGHYFDSYWTKGRDNEETTALCC
uniref:Uncharacterized protein n=1 Tax=Pundamilia nyererei TaxID=303518 RepID=A0A3B4GHF6_9CICH